MAHMIATILYGPYCKVKIIKSLFNPGSDEVIGWRIPLMTLTPGMKIHRMDMTLACMQEWLYDIYHAMLTKWYGPYEIDLYLNYNLQSTISIKRIRLLTKLGSYWWKNFKSCCEIVFQLVHPWKNMSLTIPTNIITRYILCHCLFNHDLNPIPWHQTKLLIFLPIKIIRK